MGSHFVIGEFTTHLAYFGWDWDVCWGLSGLLTHGHLKGPWELEISDICKEAHHGRASYVSGEFWSAEGFFGAAGFTVFSAWANWRA